MRGNNMITVKAEDYKDAYEFARKQVHENGVKQILKRTNSELEKTMNTNTSNNNIAQRDTFIYLKDSNTENVEMLQEAAEVIRKAGFLVEVDTLDYEDAYMRIYVE